MTALTELLIALGVMAGIGLGAEFHGRQVGRGQTQAKWDAANIRAESDRNKTLLADRDAALRIAATYESDLHDLRTSNAKRIQPRRAALALSAACPPASGAIGDVVLPAALVRGLFADEPGAAGPAPAGSTAGIAGPGLRPGHAGTGG